MLLSSLLFIPILGIFLISSMDSFYTDTEASTSQASLYYKKIALLTSIIILIVSLAIFMLFDFSSNQFQFVNYQYEYSLYDIYLGVDSISLYFVVRLLTKKINNFQLFRFGFGNLGESPRQQDRIYCRYIYFLFIPVGCMFWFTLKIYFFSYFICNVQYLLSLII